MGLIRWLRILDDAPTAWTAFVVALASLSGPIGAIPPTVAIIFVLPMALIIGWLHKTRSALFLAGGLALLFGFRYLDRFEPDPMSTSILLMMWISLLLGTYVGSTLRQVWTRGETLARRDMLTGLQNAFGFEHALTAERNRAIRFEHPLTVAYMDCDHFKAVNDRYGHATGDRLLKEIGKTLEAATRNYDTVARLGGDEFGVILPNTPTKIAQHVMGRLLDDIRKSMADNDWPVTVSAGVVTFCGEYPGVDESIRIADQQMYCVKEAEKNAVVYREIVDGELREAELIAAP